MLASLHINITNYLVVSISLLKENIYTFVGRKNNFGVGGFPSGTKLYLHWSREVLLLSWSRQKICFI